MRRHLLTAALLLASASVVPAQGTAPAKTPLGMHMVEGEARQVRGRVVRGGDTSARAVAGAWVVLHRVGTDRAAPLDSVRTGSDGRYAFNYHTSGDARALYFVSSSYGGIAYFTSPLKTANVRGDDAELVVYDTTSRTVPLTVRARHLVVSAPDSTKRRTIVEIFELSNDSTVTRIAGADSTPVWSSDMLDGARDPRVGQADFSPDAVSFANGQVRLYAPFAPGLKQFSWSYTVPADTKDFSLLVGAPAVVLEVLVEDPLARVEGAGIVAAPSAAVNGRTFSRYLAQSVPANTVVRVHAPTAGPASGSQLKVLLVVAALGAALLVGLASAMMRRPLTTRSSVVNMDSASLRTQLAALDESFANLDNPTAEQKADHWQQRAHLNQQLTDVLAREQGLQ